MDLTRRSMMKGTAGAGALGLGTLAGCTDALEAADGDFESGYAAFFTLWDWANQVSGDEVTFENPVEVGRMGHGWEPDGDIAREIADTDAFVYLDTPEFSWAQNVATVLEADYDHITVIDGMDGLESELLEWDHDHGHDHGDDDHHHDDDHDDHHHDDDHDDHHHDDDHDDHHHDDDHDDHHHDDDHDDHHHDDDHDDHHHDDDHDDHHHDDDHDDHHHDDDGKVSEMEIVDRERDAVVADVHGDHWHGGLPQVEHGDYVSLGAIFHDADGEEIPLGTDEEYQFDARVEEGSDGEASVESHGDHVHLHGEATGRVSVVFGLYHDGHAEWEAPPIDAEIVEEVDDATTRPEFADPHVWVDPVLAQEIVETIADGLSEADPDNADTYADNAAAYAERLAALDEAYEELVAEASHDVGVLAGHDSFQYIEERYGFELHTPTGVSPDDSPSQEDIADTIDVVDENDIETVLYDPFETADGSAPPLAETIVENSTATEMVPITPAEATTQEWNDQGWGYIEQVEEVTIPALRAALGAE